MPDITPNLGLKKPLGNETVSRTAYNENLELLDQNAAKVVDLANLAGAGRTTETVKGNADDIAAHFTDKIPHIDALKLNQELTYTDGKLIQVIEKEGATVKKTTNLSYTGDTLTQVEEIVAGQTITSTLNYINGVLTSITKVVS